MEIYFLRHCEADYKLEGQENVLDVPLTKKGQTHAKSLDKMLSRIIFDIIICSDALRTKQTIKPFLIKHNIKIVYDKRLREVEDILTGYSAEHNFEESVEDQKLRLESIIEDLQKIKFSRVLIVAHFNVIEYISKQFDKHIIKPTYGSLNRISI